MRMFVLKNVELIEVTDNPSYIDHCEPKYPPLYAVKPEEAYQTITKEMIEGRIFINERNERICFGISKEAEKMIGMSFDTIDSLSKQIEIDEDIIKTVKTELMKFKNMSFGKRFKMLFSKPKLSCV